MSPTPSSPTYRQEVRGDRPRPTRPNVVIVLLDDVGFAQFGCFGAEIETPAIDRLADNGLAYNRFHVTSICSSSRAALMTGRNHHAVGMGSVADSATGAPGYTSRIPASAATMQRVFRDAGYNTFAVGKWHLTPNGERSHAGPFTQWPLGTGFERYYGFLRADANQWIPNLVADNHAIDPPRTPEEGYHLTEDMADQAISMILDQQHAAPERPFFLYFAPGAMHAPHQVTQPWIDRYSGRFDDGWEAMRERIFQRQVERGIVPADTVLPDRPDWIADWDQLESEDRELYSRMHEVFAGFMTHTDAQIGRLVEFLDEIDELDNTIFVVTSDNGASAEGGEIGAVNEHNFTLRIEENRADNLNALDSWGGERGYYHYAWGWAWAGNTPLRLWKRYAWLGGTRTPMVVHWPAGIDAAGETRSQFCHIIDLMPTLLDCCDVQLPASVDGVEQQPLDGASFASTFDDPAAPNPRTKQYFEMMGSRGMWSDEWKATTNHVCPILLDEVRLMSGSHEYENDQWSLFHLPSDFSEANDVAHEHPEVLERLKSEWLEEAERNNVFPLMGGYDPREIDAGPREQANGATVDTNPYLRRVFRPGGSPITDEVLPKFHAGGTVTARIDVDGVCNGVICAIGDWTQGWALYAVDGVLELCVNIAGVESLAIASEPVGSETREVGFRLTPQADGGVAMEVLIDGGSVGSGTSPHSMPIGMLQVGGTGLCIGRDRGFPVTDRYTPPSEFSGLIHYLAIEIPDAASPPPGATLAQALHED